MSTRSSGSFISRIAASAPLATWAWRPRQATSSPTSIRTPWRIQDWLTYLAWKFKITDHVGVGGPNLPPPEESWLANCVASAPGSPTQILLDDETAEHIPGCNMAFRKSALAEIGGFDTTYTAAGDDVDICWRLQERGHTIGFSPSAIVWHHRRKTVKSYLKQQMGYGKAEAMLLQKHPDRFNAVGCARWAGRIYGGIRTSLSTAKGFIYYGPFGSGLFQRVYHAPHSWLADLPLSLEWNIVTVLLLLGGFFSPLLLILGGLSGVASAWAVVQQTLLTNLPVKHHRRLGKLLVGALHYIQPLARGWARVKRVWQQQPRATRWPGFLQRLPWGTWKRRVILSYWTEDGIEKDAILQSLIQQLREGGYPTLTDSGWKPGTWRSVNICGRVSLSRWWSKTMARQSGWHASESPGIWPRWRRRSSGPVAASWSLAYWSQGHGSLPAQESPLWPAFMGHVEECVGYPGDEQDDQRCRSQFKALTDQWHA